MTYHSPTGGSRAAQFIACPGSVALFKLFQEEYDRDDPDYRVDGVAAHEVAAECLRTGRDAWEFVGDYPRFDAEHASAVQFYVDLVRKEAGSFKPYVEQTYGEGEEVAGTLDAWWPASLGLCLVGIIRDYKHGVGIAVDAVNNIQLLYYAELVRRANPLLEGFDLGIVQPRAFHPDGPVRTWRVTAAYVKQWAEEVLLPAIERTKHDVRFIPGSHCQLCPRKLVCPALVGMSKAVALSPEGTAHIQAMTDEQLGYEFQLTKPAELYFKAVASEAMKRTFAGATIPGVKTVKKKADRVWKEGAAAEFNTAYGDEAFEPAKLKSPAAMEKVAGKTMVSEWSVTPDAGYTIAPETDRRKAVSTTAIPQRYIDSAHQIEHTE